jgi:transposase
VLDDEMVAIRLMSERRADLVQARTATVNHLHQLLMELIPAGAERKLTAAKAKVLIATIRPRDVAGRTRRQLAVDLTEDVTALDRKLKDLDKRLKTAVEATGTTVTDIKGVGIATAAMILGEVGDVRRFPSRNHFATYTGTAPRDVSTGGVPLRRLSRAGNRKLNHALHIIALSNKPLRRPRCCLLREEARGRQGQQRRPALPQATTLRPRLSTPRRRPATASGGGSGRAIGGDYKVLRD